MKLPRVIKTRRGKLDFGQLDTVVRRFVRYVRPFRTTLAVAAAATIGAVVMQIAAPWPIKFIFDLVLSDAMVDTQIGRWFAVYGPTPGAALAIICAAVMFIAVADAGFVYLRDVLLAQTGQHVVGKLRHDLFRHMQRLSPDVFESRRTGDLLMRLTSDMQMLRQMLVNAWIKAGENLLAIVAVIAIMFWLNPLLAAVATAMMPLAAWSATRISKRIRHATKNQREKESFVASIAHEVLGAMTLVQAFNRQKIELQRFARQNRGSIRAGVRTTRLESKLYRIVSVSSAVGLCAVLYLGVRAVLAGSMTAGDLLLFVAYLRSLHKPLRKLTKLVSTTAKTTACGMRIAEIFEIPPGVTDRDDAVAASAIRGRIELESVDFVYPDGTKALQGVSVVVEAG